MQTLKELKSGQLIGSKTLKLCEDLTSFPREIFTLASTLERLDLTGNALKMLPDDFHKLRQLKILFISDNNFTKFPSVLAKCPNLSMIGFRNNQIEILPENAIPLSTRWLILTDNRLKSLPESMGNLALLQKCMLSGNQLTSLPRSMQKCHNLELLRIAVNQLEALPLWLTELPKLSWLAYGGNPFCAKHPSCDTALKEISWSDLKLDIMLGEGASGLIYKAIYKGKEVALKIFKGDITSDGLPQEEMDINISMGRHPHLVDVLARVTGNPDGKDVLMLELIPPSYHNLGLPPTFESCSRDVYPDNLSFTLKQTLKILKGVASAAVHMHTRGIMHGDLYAHNIMIDENANIILGDFGGASYYEPKKIEIKQALERLEVRAFGYLMEELLSLSKNDTQNSNLRSKLNILKDACLSHPNKERPLFKNIERYLLAL
jgi:predicted Ser/Thr protein kinase